MEDNCCGHEHIQSFQDVLEEVLSIHVANCCCWQLIQPRPITAVACVSLSGYLRKADTNYSLQFQASFFSESARNKQMLGESCPVISMFHLRSYCKHLDSSWFIACTVEVAERI